METTLTGRCGTILLSIAPGQFKKFFVREWSDGSAEYFNAFVDNWLVVPDEHKRHIVWSE